MWEQLKRLFHYREARMNISSSSLIDKLEKKEKAEDYLSVVEPLGQGVAEQGSSAAMLDMERAEAELL